MCYELSQSHRTMPREYSVVQLSHKNRNGDKKTFDIDEEVVPLVQLLWEKGFDVDHIDRDIKSYCVLCKIGMPLDDFKKLICVMLNNGDFVTNEEKLKIRTTLTIMYSSYSIKNIDEFTPNDINIYVYIGINYKDIPYVISRLK